MSEMNSVSKFDRKHGGEPLLKDGMLYFEDGAKREASRWGVLISPPSDPVRLAENQMEYWEIMLRRLRRELKALKEKALADADNIYSEEDGEEWLKQLKDMRKQVKRAERKYNDARGRTLPPPPDPKKLEEDARIEEMEADERDKFIAAVDAIKI